MIGRLEGHIVAESPDGTVVLDVQGVGYEVLVPAGSLGRAPRKPDGRVTLQVHTHVREDALTLFGFADESDRGAFRLLCSVAGVGPRTAIGVLSALPVPDLAQAVARADFKRLQMAPGVGRKLAERLALELKDKLAPFVGAGSVAAVAAVPETRTTPAVRPAAPGNLGRLVDALVRTGFKVGEAERVAGELRDQADLPLETLLREALSRLTV